jgi:hypothetical protein
MIPTIRRTTRASVPITAPDPREKAPRRRYDRPPESTAGAEPAVLARDIRGYLLLFRPLRARSKRREYPKGSTRPEVKSRRQSQRRQGSSCGDGWSAWSATVRDVLYSLVRIIAMSAGVRPPRGAWRDPADAGAVDPTESAEHIRRLTCRGGGAAPNEPGLPLLLGPGSFDCSRRAGESRQTRATRPVVSGRSEPPWATLPLANSRATARAVKPSPSQTRQRSALAELPAGTASHLVFAPEPELA